MKDKNIKLAERWLGVAKRDWQTANLLFQENHFTDIICFHLQQAIEKYLKGFLVFHKINPPRVHDLPKLLKMCVEIDVDFSDWEDECAILNQCYLESRYPPDAPLDYPRSEIKKIMEQTQQFAKFIIKKLK